MSGRRIGIVMMSAIGDAVHVLPVVTALKRHDRSCHIAWVLQPGPASLVRGHPSVDEIIVFDRRRGLRGLFEVRRAMAAQSLDLLIDLQVYAKASVVTALAPARVKLGFDRARARDLNWLVTTQRIPPHAPQHVQDQYFEFLTALGVPAEPVVWDLGPWPAERDRPRAPAISLGGPLATLVIGASHPEKEWPADRWAAVCDALVDRWGLIPVLAGGSRDRERATQAAIMARACHRPRSTLGVPLRDLVMLLDASELVIALDTGPLHMAVALDRPVVSLMGYNNPKRVGPYRRFHDLIVDAYGDPGEHYPISLAHRYGRMPRIQVDDVLAKVEHWASTHRAAPRPLR